MSLVQVHQTSQIHAVATPEIKGNNIQKSKIIKIARIVFAVLLASAVLTVVVVSLPFLTVPSIVGSIAAIVSYTSIIALTILGFMNKDNQIQ